MSKADAAVSEEKLAWYEKLVAAFPGVQRKGATMPYTSLNGHMFSFLMKEGTLALRLGDEARKTFLKKYRTTLCEQYGRVMKEYAVVPDKLLKKTAELKPWFQQSIDYVGSLKPKPTTRKSAKKKATAKKKTSKR